MAASVLPLCVVFPLAVDGLATLDGKDALGFGEVEQIGRHLVGHGGVGLQALSGHGGHGALNHVLVLQWQEGHKEVHQVLVNQARAPQAACQNGDKDCSESWAE